MTKLKWWADTLTSEDVLIFARYGFGCKDCPANTECEYLTKRNGKKLCNSYHYFCKVLESEVTENDG